MAGGKKKNKTGAVVRQASVFFEEVTAFLLLAVSFGGLLWQGLLFETDNIPAVILLSLLSFAVLLKTRVAGEGKAGQLLIVSPFLLLAVASALSLTNAVYLHNAAYALCKNSSYLLLVFAVQALGQKIPFGRWLTKALMIAGVAVAALGLDAVWGGHLAGAVNAFLNGGPLAEGEQGFLFFMISGDRLASVFQYPNTTASFLLAAWFAAAHRRIHGDVYMRPAGSGKPGGFAPGGSGNEGGSGGTSRSGSPGSTGNAGSLSNSGSPSSAGRSGSSSWSSSTGSTGRPSSSGSPGKPGGARNLGSPGASAQWAARAGYWRAAELRPGAILTAGGANLIFLAFILTVSRGMYLVSVPMMLLYAFFLPKANTRRALLLYALCFMPGLFIGFLALPGAALRQIHPGLAWLLMLALVLASGSLAGWLGRSRQGQGGQGEGKAGKTPRLKMGLKPRIAIAAFSAGLFCLLLTLVFAWNSSRPFVLSRGQNLIRQFSLEQAGDYLLAASFTKPLESTDGVRLMLQSRDRRQMLRDVWDIRLETDLTPFIGQSEAVLPFSLTEENVYLMLGLQVGAGPEPGAGAAGNAGAGSAGDAVAAAANSLVSLKVIPAGAPGSAAPPAGTGPTAVSMAPKTAGKEIKLSRYLFSESLVQRIEVVLDPKTMYDRFGFYLDGFQIFRDYPLTGIGGDSWRFIYASYQKYHYVANDPHSYAMQLPVEYGISGLLIFLGFAAGLVILFAQCIKDKREGDIVLLMIVGTLFAHSMIDVDFTFYGQFLIFAMGFSLIRRPSWFRHTVAGKSQADGGQDGQAAISSVSAPPGAARSRIPRQRGTALQYLRDAAIVLLLAFICIVSACMSRADAYLSAYLYYANEGEEASASAMIERALKLDPAKPEYKAAVARQIAGSSIRTESDHARANGLAEQARRQGRYSDNTLLMLADYYMQQGLYNTAWEVNRRMTEIGPFINEYWIERGKLAGEILAVYAGEAWREERGLWLERGLGIVAEMERLSVDKWAGIEPDAELSALLASWQIELAELGAE